MPSKVKKTQKADERKIRFFPTKYAISGSNNHFFEFLWKILHQNGLSHVYFKAYLEPLRHNSKFKIAKFENQFAIIDWYKLQIYFQTNM